MTGTQARKRLKTMKFSPANESPTAEAIESLYKELYATSFRYVTKVQIYPSYNNGIIAEFDMGFTSKGRLLYRTEYDKAGKHVGCYTRSW